MYTIKCTIYYIKFSKTQSSGHLACNHNWLKCKICGAISYPARGQPLLNHTQFHGSASLGLGWYTAGWCGCCMVPHHISHQTRASCNDHYSRNTERCLLSPQWVFMGTGRIVFIHRTLRVPRSVHSENLIDRRSLTCRFIPTCQCPCSDGVQINKQSSHYIKQSWPCTR